MTSIEEASNSYMLAWHSLGPNWSSLWFRISDLESVSKVSLYVKLKINLWSLPGRTSHENFGRLLRPVFLNSYRWLLRNWWVYWCPYLWMNTASVLIYDYIIQLISLPITTHWPRIMHNIYIRGHRVRHVWNPMFNDLCESHVQPPLNSCQIKL